MIFERLEYLAVFAPFLADRIRTGAWPSTAPALCADAALGLLFLAFAIAARRVRQRVERVNALRETLYQAIIHDLKNPMTSIMGAISVSVSDKLGEREKRSLLSMALQSCRMQMSLLETLVDTSRLEFDEMTPQWGEVRIRDLLAECLAEISGLAAQMGVVLEDRSPPSTGGEFEADQDLVRRVLINLLQNAVKYTPKGGRVSIEGVLEQETVRFVVRDDGAGISEAEIARLFKKYYRVEGREQAGRRGSGIGLYFSRLVVEAHGGAIVVRARGDAGTVVEIRLPRRRPARVV